MSPFPFNLFYPDRGDFTGFVDDLSSRKLVRRSIELFRQHRRFPSQGPSQPAGSLMDSARHRQNANGYAQANPNRPTHPISHRC